MKMIAEQYERKRLSIHESIKNGLSASLSGAEYYPKPWDELDIEDDYDLSIINTNLTWNSVTEQHEFDGLKRKGKKELQLRMELMATFREPCSDERSKKIAGIEQEIRQANRENQR